MVPQRIRMVKRYGVSHASSWGSIGRRGKDADIAHPCRHCREPSCVVSFGIVATSRAKEYQVRRQAGGFFPAGIMMADRRKADLVIEFLEEGKYRDHPECL